MCIYKIYISFINPHHIKIDNVKYILFVSQNFNLKSPFSTTNGFCSLLPTTDPKKGKRVFFPPRRTAQRFGIIPEGRAVAWGTGMMQPKLVTKPPASRAPLRGARASCCPQPQAPLISHRQPLSNKTSAEESNSFAQSCLQESSTPFPTSSLRTPLFTAWPCPIPKGELRRPAVKASELPNKARRDSFSHPSSPPSCFTELSVDV